MSVGKRLFDLFWTILGLIILSPLFLIVAVLIKLDDGGAIFFRQERIGFQGRPFRIWKFRTMVVDADKKGKPLTVARDPRITRIGYWLRRFKLDELPQLFNVLVGEMSLVGPRPEVSRYVDLYTPEQRQILQLTPGITDPASIIFRSESEILASALEPERLYTNQIMPQKLRLNLEYGERANILNDFMVIVKTILVLLRE